MTSICRLEHWQYIIFMNTNRKRERLDLIKEIYSDCNEFEVPKVSLKENIKRTIVLIKVMIADVTEKP